MKGENSRRRPRTAELPCDMPDAETANAGDGDIARARKCPKLASNPNQEQTAPVLRRGVSVEDLLSDMSGDAEVGPGEAAVKAEKEKERTTSEAEEAWGAAAALMELFSRERVDDPGKTAGKAGASQRRNQDGMPPPPPYSTPRSNPQTPRGARGSTPRANSPHKAGGASALSGKTLADRVAAAVSTGLGDAVHSSPRGGGGRDDRDASVDSSPCMSPRGPGAGDSDSKHNKYCHFCQHIKVKKAKSMRACTNPECARRFCEHCLSVHMSEALESLERDVEWLCPICRKVCCCAVQTCDKAHRHCKAYRYRLRRAELAAKRGPPSACSSAAQTPRDHVPASVPCAPPPPPPPPLSSLRAALEAGIVAASAAAAAAAAASSSADLERDSLREATAEGDKTQGATVANSLFLKVAAAAVAAASASALSLPSSCGTDAATAASSCCKKEEEAKEDSSQTKVTASESASSTDENTCIGTSGSRPLSDAADLVEEALAARGNSSDSVNN